MLTYLELIIAPILLAYSIILTVKWKKTKPAKKIFIIATIGVSFLIAYNGIVGYKKNELIKNIEASYGEIVKGNNTTIPSIRLGNPVFFTTINYPKNQYGIFLGMGRGRELIKVHVDKGKLFVNVIIRDYNKEIIAVISENTWKLFDSNYEYNNDKNAFELVTKGDRKVFMHIEFKDGFVYVEGFFITQIFGIYILPNYETDDLWLHIVDGDNDGDNLNKDIYFSDLNSGVLNPIFKYPREKYFGVRMKND